MDYLKNMNLKDATRIALVTTGFGLLVILAAMLGIRIGGYMLQFALLLSHGGLAIFFYVLFNKQSKEG
ncbi:MAG: hypothetical protein H0T73_13835 [Ardenticatenales bacterium]|nr:hypothetical protein [Ardenticatenales bacterium]